MRTRLSKSKVILRTTVALVLLASLAGIVVATDAHPAGASTQQQAIVNYAASQKNVPYCEGGGGINGPTAGSASSQCVPISTPGFDCMTLAQYAVYQGTGIVMPADPSTGPGTFIPPNGLDTSNIQPGDVVFFGGGSTNDPVLSQYKHSGIYAGDNEIWDALKPGDSVAEELFSTVYSDYGNVYDGAVQYWSAGVSSPGSPPNTQSYDLVGSDGGVFAFNSPFVNSLPGLGVHVNNITGIVPTATDTGYYLVGSDGGVFAFNAPFVNSLPGIGVRVNDIVGIVPTVNDQGYFLVGSDGGVFAFNAPFEQSLPGLGVHVNDITGIAATPDDQGYWLVGANGNVYAFGDAPYFGNAPAGARGITATGDGDGYWVVGSNGAVTPFGDAGNFSDLPALGVSVNNIVGIVVTPDSQGYNLIGSDGGVFSFGDAENLGSLPGLGIHVNNVVGAVPT
jgi:cell wall-associated NlpC family hydrolase